MKTSIALLSLIITLTACTPRLPEGANGECAAFWPVFKESWQHDPEQDIYAIGKMEVELIQHRACFHGLRQKQVSKLLGKPNAVDSSTWWYYLQRQCHTSGIRNSACAVFALRFDAQGLVVDASRMTWSGSEGR